MITAIIGYFSLIATFLLICFGSILSIYETIRSNQKSSAWTKKINQLILILLSTTIIVILVQLLLQNFQFVYVSKTTQDQTPILLRIAALWAAQEGSILFWIWLISISNYIIQPYLTKLSTKTQSITFIFQNLPIALFLLYLIIGENPFYLYWMDQDQEIWLSIFNLNNWPPYIPANGAGLNPLLHHYAMIIHPPILYLGFSTMWIPTILAFTNIYHKQAKEYSKIIKKWAIISWCLLTVGIALGSRWAFDLLSWGGYWSWDAVETASLLPWISQTVLLHHIFKQNGNHNNHTKTQTLIFLTNFFITFEIFITRSGIINSVHAFANSERSDFFLILLLLNTIIFGVSLVQSIKFLITLENNLSKSIKYRLFSLINSSLLIYAFYLLLGLIYPLIQQAINKIEVVVDQKYYQIGTTILWIFLLLILTAYLLSSIKNKIKWLFGILVLPVILISNQWIPSCILFLVFINIYLWILYFFDYKKISIKKIAILTIHLSILFISIGIIGMEYLSTDQIIPISSQATIVDQKYQIQIKNVSQTTQDQEQITLTSATLELTNTDQNQIAILTPAQTFDENTLQSINLPAQKHFFLDTLSISIAGYDQEQQALLLLIQYHRFSNLLWGAAICLTAGGLLLGFGKMKGKGKNTREK